MYKEPLDVQSLSAHLGQIPFFVSLFFFFSTPAPLPGQEEETGEIMFFPPHERAARRKEEGEATREFLKKSRKRVKGEVITAVENGRDSPHSAGGRTSR